MMVQGIMSSDVGLTHEGQNGSTVSLWGVYARASKEECHNWKRNKLALETHQVGHFIAAAWCQLFLCPL